MAGRFCGHYQIFRLLKIELIELHMSVRPKSSTNVYGTGCRLQKFYQQALRRI